MFQEISVESLEINPFTMCKDDTFLVTAVLPDGTWNTMTAAWGTLGWLWNRPVFCAFIRPSRHTHGFVERAKGFTCSFFPPEMADVLRFCGTHSGRDTDKAADTGLEPVVINTHGDDRMTFSQANMVFSCTKVSKTQLDSSMFLDPGIESHYKGTDYHTLYIGFIDSVLINA